MVRSSPLPALLPRLSLEDRQGGSSRPGRPSGSRPPLVLPQLPEPVGGSVVFGMGRMDVKGRVIDRVALTSLRWAPTERIGFTVREGLIVVRRDPDGTRGLGEPCLLRLPVAVRRACRLNAGDPLLLAALPDEERLIVHPPATLASLTARVYQLATGGEGR